MTLSDINVAAVAFFLQKRPVPLDSVESTAAKRQRLADQRLQEQPAVNGLHHHPAAHTHHTGYHSKTDFQRTSSNTANQNGSPGGPAGFPLTHRPSECREHQAKDSSRQPSRQGDCDPQVALSQHRKKKSKKHKDKERERSKDKKVSEWSQTSPELKQKQHKLDGEDTFLGFLGSVVFNMSVSVFIGLCLLFRQWSRLSYYDVFHYLLTSSQASLGGCGSSTSTHDWSQSQDHFLRVVVSSQRHF